VQVQVTSERPKYLPKKVPAAEAAASPYNGRVLDPRGKPVAGATLYSAFLWGQKTEHPPLTSTSDADGRFQLLLPGLPKEEFPSSLPQPHVVVAKAPGFGLGITKVGASERPDVLNLVDDEPITVRVLDLEGRPVVGATIRPEWLWCPKDGDLTARLQAYAHPELPQPSELPGLSSRVVGMIAPAITGTDGRVRIEGVGRERLLTAVVEGPTIETTEITIMTRRGDTVRPGTSSPENVSFEPPSTPTAGAASKPFSPVQVTGTLTGTLTGSIIAPGSKGTLQFAGSAFTMKPGTRTTVQQFYEREILGPSSDVILAPSQPISGTVRDRSTGQPLAGVEIRTDQAVRVPVLQATT
ncbi:carboxypeptidase-like regulatory domain-containing protein, partial [Singulisphaera rosea]